MTISINRELAEYLRGTPSISSTIAKAVAEYHTREIEVDLEAADAEVHERLHAERGLASTTIATMLMKMEKKGVVTHRTEGRRYIYRPTVSENEVARNMVAEIKDRLFQGDPVALVSHLLTEHDVDADELEDLKKLIASHGRRTND